MIEPDEIIYLDNNATTRLDPLVMEEMQPFLERYYGNPSSGYGFGAQVRRAVDLARERVAALLGCTPGEVIFTSSGTEASNTAIYSTLQLNPARPGLVTTAVEHSATLRVGEQLVRRSQPVTFLGVDGEGLLDLDELESALTPQTALLSTMWGNNETGVLFPVEQIAEIAQRRGVLFHADAVQAVGKLPIRLSELPVGYLSISAHKIHGPKGVGALYVNRRVAFRPLLFGGEQEEGRRSGTENVASIVGFGKAAELALAQLDQQAARVRALRDQLEAELCARLPQTFVNGSGAPRLPNTANLSFAGIEAQAALILLDQKRLCLSAGSACRTGSAETSHVLRAMGLSEERQRSALRFSLSRMTLASDLERAVEVVTAVVMKLRRLAE